MKVYLNKELVGQSLPSKYNIDQSFKIFRYAELRKKAPDPEAWFIVRFRLKHMDVKKNRVFSLLPMFILFHFKGFRSKYWLMNEATNTCMGVYRWQTLEDAKRYSKSLAMKFMTRRSVEGSIQFSMGVGEQPICEF
ncbi:MAG: hypothetical protein E7231_17270 [Cellulosilyticum sp.]|nr:hypothetical protein [Cellulosilyticum sp.]